jgi:hypothetical protein
MENVEKVVFLDIDGVLQPLSSQKRFDYDLDELRKDLADKYQDEEYLKMDKYDLGAIYYDWLKESVELLRQLCDKTNAKIVISSSWREYSDLSRLKKYFKIYELDSYVIDVTPILSYPLERADEVEQYLKDNQNIKKFVIFDDAFTTIFEKKFPKEFFYCDYILSKTICENALKVL